MHPSRVRPIITVLVPAIVAVGVVLMALFGDNGLIQRHQLKLELEQLRGDVAHLHAENQSLKVRILRLRDSPMAVSRVAAEQLFMASQGSVIYRFVDKPEGAIGNLPTVGISAVSASD